MANQPKKVTFSKQAHADYDTLPFSGGSPRHGGLSARQINRLATILHEGTSDFLNASDLGEERARLWEDLRDPSRAGILLRQKGGKHVRGFAYIMPASSIPHIIKKVGDRPIQAKEPLNAVVGWIIVHPKHRKKGAARLLMQALDEQVRQSYAGIIWTARTRNGFAKQVREYYLSSPHRIMHEAPLVQNPYGPQEYVRVAYKSPRFRQRQS